LNPRFAVLAGLLTVTIVWQVPHTIVFRYALLVLLGLVAWPAAVEWLARPATDVGRRARRPFEMLLCFIAWSLAVAFFVARVPAESLNDLRAEWLAPTLVLLLGYGLALRFPERDAVVRVIFLGFVLHAFMQLVTALYMTARGVPLNFANFGGISDHKANVTYTSALALAMLIADTVARARGSPGFLRINTPYALVAFALLACSTVLATTRNGLVVFALMSFAAVVLVARALSPAASRRGWAALGACIALVIAGLVVGFKADPRWSSFRETAPIAWDTDANPQWLNGERNETDLPMTASGKPVDPSAYYRIAFLKEGLRIMNEHPFGTRVGRDAFRKAVQEKYGRGGMSHAHNGILDLGVSLGWVGVILWVAFMGSFAVFAARAQDPERSGLRLALVLATAAFLMRSLLDATVRDHIIQEYMLIAGALVGAIVMAGSRDRG
jgi:O-antigen ligase